MTGLKAEMEVADSSSGRSEQVAKVAKEQKGKAPLASIDEDLRKALQSPHLRNTGQRMLAMETKILEAMENPDLQGVEFPKCINSFSKKLAGIVAQYYGLEPPCTKSIRVFAKKTPDSRIPSILLSSIPLIKPKEEMSKDPQKITILKKKKRKKQSNGASSNNFTAPETKVKTLKEREEYNKARARIFDEEAPSVHPSPVVSDFISPIRGGLDKEGSPDGTNARQEIGNSVHNHSANLNSDQTRSSFSPLVAPDSTSNFTTPETKVRTLKEREEYNKARARVFNEEEPSVHPSPVVSDFISPVRGGLDKEGSPDGTSGRQEKGNSVHNHSANLNSDQTRSSFLPLLPLEGTSGRQEIRNSVHNHSADLNSDQTRSRHDEGTRQFGMGLMSPPRPQFMQYDAINFQHQMVPYQPSIAQPQLMQYGASVSQYMPTPYYENPIYYPYYASNPLQYQAYPGYSHWSMQPPSQGPMQFQPNDADSELLQDGESISRPPLDPQRASAMPYMPIPYYYPYNPADPNWVQWPLQSMQPLGQDLWPRVNMAYGDFYNGFPPRMPSNQEAVNMSYSSEDGEQERSELRDGLYGEQLRERWESTDRGRGRNPPRRARRHR